MSSKSKVQRTAKTERVRATRLREKEKRKQYRLKYFRKRVAGIAHVEKEKVDG